MKTLAKRNSLALLISLTGSATSVVVNPWTNYDPINLPKLAVLLIPLPVVIAWSVLNSSAGKKVLAKVAVGTWALYSIYLILNALYVAENSAQAIWGTWGRNTGVMAYIALSGLLASTTLMDSAGRKLILNIFTKLSYFITGYTFIQFLELDPINWGQNLTFATLGNINFMSSFLGFANLLFLGKLLREQLVLSARIHFMFLIALNSFLILDSGSIQGVTMFAAGAGLSLIITLWERGKRFPAIFSAVSLTVMGTCASMTVAGFGPLGTKFLQDTVLYRFDYWQAGWKMFVSSPLFGLGLDSYGDYYREFRSQIAVERTGPARVANTAHNIFLDLMSGGGILGVSFLLGSFILSGFLSIRIILRYSASSEVYLLLPMVFGFLIFCLISINQLGVGVWGFMFIGLLIAASTGGGNPSKDKKEMMKSNLQKESKRARSVTHSPQASKVRKGWLLIASLSISGLFTFFVSQQLRTDIGFLRAYKEGNPNKMETYLDDFSSTGFYEDKLMVYLSEKGLESEALRIAKKIVLKDPRQFTAWSVIAYSPNSTIAEKVSAGKALTALDPFNDLLKEELKDLPTVG